MYKQPENRVTLHKAFLAKDIKQTLNLKNKNKIELKSNNALS